MAQRYAAAAGKASFGAASRCSNPEGGLPLISTVMRVARDWWPSKTALELAARTGASERMCRYWLSETYDLSADHLAELLCSDAGLEILEGIMERRASKPAWWQAFRRRISIETMEAKLEAVADELAALKRERTERRAGR